LRKCLARATFAIALGLLIVSLSQTRSRAQAPTPTPVPKEMVPLIAGIQNLATTCPAGTPVSVIAASVTPPGALEAIWRLDNAQQKYFGYSPSPAAEAAMANDYNTVIMALEPIWFIMRQDGTLSRPIIPPNTTQLPPCT
jgi:hypothetical protein